jgi:ribosomal-protein-alanine N-acetyltransferase
MIIRPLSADVEREACARMMATSEPWITLGQTYERALALLALPDREVYVAREGETVAGFAVVSMQGILAGYVQTIAVAEPFRAQGIGAHLMRKTIGPLRQP